MSDIDTMRVTDRREPIVLALIPAETEAQSCLLLCCTSGVRNRYQHRYRTAMLISPTSSGTIVIKTVSIACTTLKQKNGWKKAFLYLGNKLYYNKLTASLWMLLWLHQNTTLCMCDTHRQSYSLMRGHRLPTTLYLCVTAAWHWLSDGDWELKRGTL